MSSLNARFIINHIFSVRVHQNTVNSILGGKYYNMERLIISIFLWFPKLYFV